MANEVRSITLDSIPVTGITFDNMRTVFGTEEYYGWDSSNTYGFSTFSYGYISHAEIDGEAGIEAC